MVDDLAFPKESGRIQSQERLYGNRNVCREKNPEQTRPISYTRIPRPRKKSETERLNELVDNLLLASKMETAYEPTYEKFNLVELIDNLVARLAMKYPKSSITFTHELEAVHTVADKFGLTLVIVNLIENAKKYSFGNAEIKVSLDQTEDGLTLQIGDQGIGIADKNKKKVFDRFYRIGDEETRKTKGTGLGLYIVKQVISAANGKIAILDNRPKGTIVDIFLPNKETPKAYITE